MILQKILPITMLTVFLVIPNKVIFHKQRKLPVTFLEGGGSWIGCSHKQRWARHAFASIKANSNASNVLRSGCGLRECMVCVSVLGSEHAKPCNCATQLAGSTMLSEQSQATKESKGKVGVTFETRKLRSGGQRLENYRSEGCTIRWNISSCLPNA